jgi:glycosyltransferase involved in cell wall biosynthesis
MRVLLIGNYVADGQQSMQRFGAMLRSGLERAGVTVELVRAEPVFGKIGAGTSGAGKWLGYLDKFILFPRRLRRIVGPFDIVHICDHSNSPTLRAIRDTPHLITCHDLLAVRSALGEFPQNPVRWSGKLLQQTILNGLRGTGAIVADSRATMRDLARLLGRDESAIPVIHPGVHPAYRPKVLAPGEAPPGNGYLLHVGGDQWYKNREGLVRIYSEIRNRLGDKAPDLVVVGPRLETVVPGIRIAGGISDEGLRDLYAGARLLLFPSFAEGYGWPVLEAMACGCPVIATGKTPMTEIGGEVAVYFDDPDAHEDVAAAAIRVLEESPGARAKRIEAGIARAAEFSTEAMASGYIAVYRNVIEGHSPSGAPNAEP